MFEIPPLPRPLALPALSPSLSPSPFPLPTSCGRDQVVLLWDVEKARTVKTVAVFEVGSGSDGERLCCALSVFTTHHSLPRTQSLEGVSLLPVGVTIPTGDGEVIMTSSANICCATAGEKGEGV